MINQIPFYKLEIFKAADFSFSMSALLLVIILIVALMLRNRYRIFNYLLMFSYLLILLALNKIFIFNKSKLPIFDFELFSKLSFYLYNIFHYSLASLNTFFMVYAHLTILSFIPFYLIFKKHRYFLFILISFNALNIIFNILNFNGNQVSLFNITLACLGYLGGYLLEKIVDLSK